MTRSNSEEPGAAHAAAPAPDAVAAVEQELAFLVRGLEALQRLRSYPLERAQYLMLRLIADEGPQPVATIAARLLLDDSTVTRQVADMERLHLIEKHPNPADRRSALVNATQHGRAQARNMLRMRLSRAAEMMRGWPEADQARFADLLGRFNRVLVEMVRK